MNDACKYTRFVMPINMPRRATPFMFWHTRHVIFSKRGKLGQEKKCPSVLFFRTGSDWCDATPSRLGALTPTWAWFWWSPVLGDNFRDLLKINHDRTRPHETLSNSHWLLSAVQAVKWSLAMGSWTTLNNQSEGTTTSHCKLDLPLHYTQTIIQVDTSDT